MQHATPPPPRRRGLIPWLFAVSVVIAALVGVVYAATRPLGGGDARPSFYVVGSPVPGTQIGQIAPGSAKAPASPRLTLTGLDGAPLALADFAGHPMWIIFWKTACEPCEAEAADVAAAYTAHRPDGLVIVGIDVWDSAEEVRDYVGGHSFKYPVATNPSAGFMDAYGVWGAPIHYFIDSAGIIEDRYFGPMTREQIEEALRKVI